MPESRPEDQNHHVIRYMFLEDEIKNALFFRFLIRLYALMEDDDRRVSGNRQRELTFGLWLDTLPSDPTVDSVKSRYASITSSSDYSLMREKRHNFLAHNALQPRNITHSYGAVFTMSEQIEQLYDELVTVGLADPIPWAGELDRRVVHETNCPGGIETNIQEFFQLLDS